MDAQDWFLVLIASHLILWRMGGAGYWPLGKGWRRFLLPLVTMGVLFGLGQFAWWLILAAVAVEIGVNTLGYGSSKPLWWKVMVALVLGLPAVALNYHLWWAPLITLSHFGLYYLISRKYNSFWWGFAEMMAGFSQGVVIVWAHTL